MRAGSGFTVGVGPVLTVTITSTVTSTAAPVFLNKTPFDLYMLGLVSKENYVNMLYFRQKEVRYVGQATMKRDFLVGRLHFKIKAHQVK